MKKLSSLAALGVFVFAPGSAFAQAPAPEATPPATEPAEAPAPAPAPATDTPAPAAPEGDAPKAVEDSTASVPVAATREPTAEAAPATISLETTADEGRTEEAALAAEAPATDAHPTSGYEKGLFIQSADGKFKMTFGGYLQGRFTRTSEDTESTDAEYGAAFSIHRARVGFKGHAYTSDLTYKFEMSLDKGAVALRDFYINYRLHDWAHLRVGQDKRPFSRQQLVSSTKNQFADVAITDKAFGAGRDIGIMLHNDYMDVEGFGYALGLYNGPGEKPNFSGSGSADLVTGEVEVSEGGFSNVPGEFEPTAVLRLEYGNGVKGFSESDLEGGGFRYGVGASGLVDMNMDSSNDAKMRAEADAIIKWQGWSVTGGYYISSTQNGRVYFEDRALEATGAHLQGGYVIGGKVEPALRWATVKTEGATDDEDVTTNAYTAGLNVFFQGHSLKWTTDFTLALVDAELIDTVTQTELRSQLQFAF